VVRSRFDSASRSCYTQIVDSRLNEILITLST
jgi:hypothetical protein